MPVQGERTPGPAPTPPGPVVDLRTPGPSSAGAQGTSRGQDRPADEDPEIAGPLEAAAEEATHRTAGLQQSEPINNII